MSETCVNILKEERRPNGRQSQQSNSQEMKIPEEANLKDGRGKYERHLSHIALLVTPLGLVLRRAESKLLKRSGFINTDVTID